MMGWMAALQVVRKRLNRPMNFAEKVRVTCASRATRSSMADSRFGLNSVDCLFAGSCRRLSDGCPI